ncbi:MAG: FecR domain-containing protein [Cytophagales bacterium]|nr:FecR domain-containing protein [Cytophagales bacterium]
MVGWSLRIAASLLLVAAVAALLVNRLGGNARQEEVYADNNISIYLPDSSYVILNKGGRITYDGFGNNRDVHLAGEALFIVRKDTNRPFRVITNTIVATALGTSFNVKSDGEDGSASVSLLSGKVEVTYVSGTKRNRTF